MAHVYGKAGQYAKQQAHRPVKWVLAGTAACVFASGWALGYFLATRHTLLGWLVGIVAATLPWIFARATDAWLDSLAKERIKWLRGAQGEALVGWLLADLDRHWHVFHNVQLKDASDIDHIVIGPGGVFAISTKNFRGLFSRASDGRVFYNNQPTGLIGDTIGQAKTLSARLRGLMGTDVPFVEAILAVPQAWVELQGPQKGVWILHQDNLVDTIEHFGKRLSPEQIARCAKAVEMLSQHAKEVWREEQKPDTSIAVTSGRTRQQERE